MQQIPVEKLEAEKPIHPVFCFVLPLGDPKEKSPDLDNRFSSKSPKYSRISEIFYFPL
jgi:hypothetical protein